MASASHPQTSELIFFDTDERISLPTKNSVGGFSLAVGDLGSDGIPELVLGNGLGSEPRVRVLRLDGSEIGSFLAYTETMGVGINVAVCDLNGNGVNEIVTAPQRGGGPHVRVFTNAGNAMGTGTFVYDKSFRSGVNLACGDLTGDGRAELVTMPSASGHPDVRVWNLENSGLKQMDGQFVFDEKQTIGLVGTIKNLQLVIAEQKTKSPRVKTFTMEQNRLKEKKETQLTIDAIGVASIVIHNENIFLTTTSNALLYDMNGVEKKISSVSESHVAVSADLNQDGKEELIITPSRPSFADNDETRIVVDLSEQRLYAYTNGILKNSFLISSGLRGSTPVGNHSILAKIPFVHYRWIYGANDPRNYDLGRVPYNLRFAPHLYLHYAYWHNNFGHPMSHGCVNISLTNMKWLYEWAKEGVRVEIVK